MERAGLPAPQVTAISVLPPHVSLYNSLQLNSLGPDACKEIRDLLLHDKCVVSNLR